MTSAKYQISNIKLQQFQYLTNRNIVTPHLTHCYHSNLIFDIWHQIPQKPYEIPYTFAQNVTSHFPNNSNTLSTHNIYITYIQSHPINIKVTSRFDKL